jgi:hypothetical protein
MPMRNIDKEEFGADDEFLKAFDDVIPFSDDDIIDEDLENDSFDNDAF